MTTEHLVDLNLPELARPLRHHEDFAPLGVNVNVVATAPHADGRLPCGPSRRASRGRP